jgi:hypothetical protein
MKVEQAEKSRRQIDRLRRFAFWELGFAREMLISGKNALIHYSYEGGEHQRAKVGNHRNLQGYPEIRNLEALRQAIGVRPAIPES